MLIQRPQQFEFYSDWTTPHQAFVGGNRSGKTTGGARKTHWLCKVNGQYKSSIGIAIEPTYDMAIKTLKPAIEEAFDYYGVDIFYNGSEHKFTIPEYNNSIIYLLSGDRPQRIESIKAAYVWVDEPAQCKPEVFQRIITRANDPDAVALITFMTGTPEGLNHYYKELMKIDPKTGKQVYKIILGSLEEIKLNTHQNYISNLESNLDPLVLREKLYGDFLNTTSGRVFYAFNEDCIIPFYQINHNLPVRISCDFNINPCVFNVHQIIGDKVFSFGEIVMYNANTPYMCDKLEEFLNSLNGRFPAHIFYGDYTSMAQRTTATSLTDWTIIQNHFKNYPGYKRNLRSNPHVKERVETQNGMFAHQRHLITRNCKYLIDDFRQVVWSKNGYDLDGSDKDRTHASDGTGYMLNYEFGINKKYSKIV